MLTVLNVAYPFAPVGPDVVGGAEQILAHIDDFLVRAGHRSLVVACAGSRPMGELIPAPHAGGLLTEAARRDYRQQYQQIIDKAIRDCSPDVVHFHGVDCYDYLPAAGVPVLVTLHLPPSWYPAEIFSLARPGTYLHCVSRSQRRACPPQARLLPEIENGVPVDQLRPGWKKRGFAVALGRICPEKGFHHALEAARRAKIPLALAGEIYPYQEHQDYFEREIVPRLDRARRFLGPIGLRRKARLLALSRCLLVTSRVAETSSLVAMEALACGTPVIAFPVGALPDIIEHGRTGLLVEDIREMADAIGRAASLDPRDCRTTALTRFSARRMCQQYLSVYGQLAQEHQCG